MGADTTTCLPRRSLALVISLLLAGCGGGVDNQGLRDAVRNHVAAEVTAQGAVTALLPDSQGTDGGHQRFIVDFGSGVSCEIDHNLSLAPRVPVAPGVTVVIHGQFEPDPGHPVIHYTHHSTSAHHEGGWIELNGQRYE